MADTPPDEGSRIGQRKWHDGVWWIWLGLPSGWEPADLPQHKSVRYPQKDGGEEQSGQQLAGA